MKVFTNGCFDVLHRGHIELLSYCANIGEVLVGLNSDKSVKRLKLATEKEISEVVGLSKAKKITDFYTTK